MINRSVSAARFAIAPWAITLRAITFRAVTLSAVALWPSLAAAACRDDIDEMVRRYALPTSSESGAQRGETPSDRLANAGSVLTPPPTPDAGTVIRPPAANLSQMPTLPNVAPSPRQPRTGEPAQQPPSDTQLSATNRARMSSLLDAAKEADRTGNEAECGQRVAEARSLAEQPPARQ
jgi:hypothetical protein